MTRLVLHRSADFALAADRVVIKRDEFAAVGDAVTMLERVRSLRIALDQQCAGARDAARESGYQAGFEAGRKAATEQLAASVALLERRMTDERAAMHNRVVDLALAVVERLAESFGPADTVAALARRVVGELDPDRPVRVRVHPSIVSAVTAGLAGYASSRLSVIADEALSPFGCEVDSDGGRIEAGLEVQLAALGEALSGLTGGPGAEEPAR